MVWFVAALQPVNSVTFAMDGVMVGADRQRLMALAMIGAAAVFALVAGAITRNGTDLSDIWWAITAFMSARLSFGLLYARRM